MRRISAITRRFSSLYERAFDDSIRRPNEFWAAEAERLVWHKKWNRVLNNDRPPFTKWFEGGLFNTCYNCCDRHIDEGFGDNVAIYYDSPVTSTKLAVTYSQLQRMILVYSNELLRLGVRAGDVVIIYMPMIPETIAAMLACARIGAIHSLVFGGFASKELANRITHAEPKVIFCASHGVEPGRIVPYKIILDDALQIADYKPAATLIYCRDDFDPSSLVTRDHDKLLNECIDESMNECVWLDATHPLYVLYTSGTTGIPKAPVRPSGGNSVVLNWSMKSIYGMQPDDAWFTSSDLGWVVGHSYICYAPLLHRNPSVLFEGKPVGTPDESALFRVLAEYGASGWFVAPTAIRAIKQLDSADPKQSVAHRFDLSKLRSVFVAGEHCDPDTLQWIENVTSKPVIDHWWQTETGSAITSSCLGLGNRPNPPLSTAGFPVPGWNVCVLNSETGVECERGELGTIAVATPLPPSSFSTLFKADDAFVEQYFSDFSGYYNTKDCGYVDDEGYVYVMGRMDDVINVAAHRISSAAIEEVILSIDDVADCACVGKSDKVKGQTPYALVVLKSDEGDRADVSERVNAAVVHSIGRIARLSRIVFVNKLPKTRSGKIARNTLAAIVNGETYKVPVTIEDASVYSHIEAIVAAQGDNK